ncbi:hypothetical protein GCM10010207_72280 [Streptomyces atratus]|nr:hypothetical protein GCM10010207_72280 [Streptomyces atratus]
MIHQRFLAVHPEHFWGKECALRVTLASGKIYDNPHADPPFQGLQSCGLGGSTASARQTRGWVSEKENRLLPAPSSAKVTAALIKGLRR